jgi:hypothetical protein
VYIITHISISKNRVNNLDDLVITLIVARKHIGQSIEQTAYTILSICVCLGDVDYWLISSLLGRIIIHLWHHWRELLWLYYTLRI